MGNRIRTWIGTWIGRANEVTKQSWNVWDLNYNSFCDSPFQCFSEEKETTQLLIQTKFKQLLQAKFPEYNQRDYYDWNLGQINKLKKERYSPLYRNDCGIQSDKLIIYDTDFEKIWQEQFKEVENKIEYTRQQKNNAKLFDLIAYKSIIIVVYEIQVNDLTWMENRENIAPYKHFLRSFNKKTFLVEKLKIQKLLIAIEDSTVDLVLIQYASNKLKQKLKNHQYLKSIAKQDCDSIIIYKPTKNLNNKPSSLDSLEKMMNTKSSCIKASKNIIYLHIDSILFISGKYTSNTQDVQNEIVNLFKQINLLFSTVRINNLVIGVSLNKTIKQFFFKTFNQSIQQYKKKQDQKIRQSQNSKKNHQYFIFAQFEDKGLRKRTVLQTISNQSSKDQDEQEFLITINCSMNKQQVQTIQGNPAKKYLPSSNHPFNHLCISAILTDYS